MDPFVLHLIHIYWILLIVDAIDTVTLDYYW
jgi:hypothetical protein